MPYPATLRPGCIASCVCLSLPALPASEWLNAKAKRLANEAKQQAALDRAISEELDWIGKK